MKRAFLFLFLGLFVFACQPSEPENPVTEEDDYSSLTKIIASKDKKTFHGIAEKVFLDYTDDWTFSEFTFGSRAAFEFKEKTNGYADNILLRVQDLGQTRVRTLDDFEALSRDRMLDLFDDPSNVTFARETINGHEASVFVHEGEVGGRNKKWKQVVIVHNLSAYLLMYEAEVESYEKHLPYADAIMNSIRFEEEEPKQE